MRKTMTKEVTKTTVKLAKMVVVDGTPQAEQMDDVVLVGNVDIEKAQKEISKKFPGQSVTVFGVDADTQVYEMSVEEFLKHATLKQPEPEQAEAAEQSA